jgi:hypothetical protein
MIKRAAARSPTHFVRAPFADRSSAGRLEVAQEPAIAVPLRGGSARCPRTFWHCDVARCCQKLTDKLKEEFLSILCWAIGHPPAGRVNKTTNSVVRS